MVIKLSIKKRGDGERGRIVEQSKKTNTYDVSKTEKGLAENFEKLTNLSMYTSSNLDKKVKDFCRFIEISRVILK